ncbi:MAG: YfdX family protein [Epsilonproteobacteria bacterium]|nr:YfdX family protein [Campylobacterota bacterium]
MKQKLLISTLISALLLGTTVLQAKTDNKTLVQHQIEKDKKGKQEAPQEIIHGLNKSFMVMALLQQHKMEEAKKLLTEATKDFEKALKENPKLDIVPIWQEVEVFEFDFAPREIAQILKMSERLIKEHRTQDARNLLMPLKDEMDINTEFIPMGIYPIATKNALSAIEKGDRNSAMAILAGAFNMLINQKVIIPLSLLSAQDLVMEASMLDKNKKDEAIKLLEEAKLELEKAELLGYTTKRSVEYKALSSSIKDIEKEIKGKNIVERLYEKLNKDFISLIKKTKDDKVKVSKSGLHDSVEVKESEALANPSSLKGVSSAKIKVEELKNKEVSEAKKISNSFTNDAKKDENKTIK